MNNKIKHILVAFIPLLLWFGVILPILGAFSPIEGIIVGLLCCIFYIVSIFFYGSIYLWIKKYFNKLSNNAQGLLIIIFLILSWGFILFNIFF